MRHLSPKIVSLNIENRSQRVQRSSPFKNSLVFLAVLVGLGGVVLAVLVLTGTFSQSSSQSPMQSWQVPPYGEPGLFKGNSFSLRASTPSAGIQPRSLAVYMNLAGRGYRDLGTVTPDPSGQFELELHGCDQQFSNSLVVCDFNGAPSSETQLSNHSQHFLVPDQLAQKWGGECRYLSRPAGQHSGYIGGQLFHAKNTCGQAGGPADNIFSPDQVLFHNGTAVVSYKDGKAGEVISAEGFIGYGQFESSLSNTPLHPRLSGSAYIWQERPRFDHGLAFPLTPAMRNPYGEIDFLELSNGFWPHSLFTVQPYEAAGSHFNFAFPDQNGRYTLQSRLSQNQVDFTLMSSPSHVAQWSFNNTFFIPQNLVQIPAQLQFNLYHIGDPILNGISYAITIFGIEFRNLG